MSDVRALLQTDLEEAQARKDAAAVDVKRLSGALRALESTNGTVTYDPEKVAGKQLIADAAAYLEARGVARQIEIARELNKNAGAVSSAMKVLEMRGIASRGPRENRSIVWTYTGKVKRERATRSKRTAAAAA